MAKKPVMSDVLMQFAVVNATWAGDTSVLAEGAHQTGLSIRGGLMWLIHLIELYLPRVLDAIDNRLYMSLSAMAGRTSMPSVTAKGTLMQIEQSIGLTTSGAVVAHSPIVHHYLPPIPFAGPNLSLYLQTDNDAAEVSAGSYARVGFTTQAVDSASYAELAEVWEAA